MTNIQNGIQFITSERPDGDGGALYILEFAYAGQTVGEIEFPTELTRHEALVEMIEETQAFVAANQPES